MTFTKSTSSYAPQRTSAKLAASEQVEVVDHGFLVTQLQLLVAVGRVWEGRDSTMWLCRLRPILVVKLGANKFLLASSSQWYPLFPTKVPGSSSHFSRAETENFVS